MHHEVLSLILGGGRGTRLYPLTMLRSKPAVPIGGKYRLIDIPISNCINSECHRIYVLTQFLSVSLHRHISNTYKFDPFSKGFVEILAAQQTNEASDWYQGTADAVRQNIRYVHEDPCRDVLILSGDQLYRMDYRQLLKTHRDSNAEATIAVMPVREEQTHALGLLSADDTGRVTSFVEKPQTAAGRAPVKMSEAWMKQRGIASQGRHYLASMGIYAFQRDTLVQLLNAPPLATDFGKDIFPRSLQSHRVHAHLFDGYWEDVGTVKSYHEANVALTADDPSFVFHAPEGVIYTRMRYLPASRISQSTLDHALISDGCVIGAGTKIVHSVVGVRTQIGKNVVLKNSVVIGADAYETAHEKAENVRRGLPHIGIGDDSVIENAILDKDARVGANVRLCNQDNIKNGEGPNFVIRDGVVVIPRSAIVLDGTVI
ncbi:MAG: glucose-1-phosphate adenylyltransferase [Planctomycetes bacterium]|nr:glucose-1-phosphate adenylyltransferase [Planctomycetota bacterium]